MNVRSSAVNITVATAPINVGGLRASDQNETSITLQWNKINNSTSFILQFNGSETFITAPDGDGPVNYKVSLLTAGTKYTFTLFSVFENVRSSGIQLIAVTAPQNAQGFTSLRQDETSITLQWEIVNNNVSFILLHNETQLTIAAPAGQQPLLLTVSSLTAGTRYTFTLFSVFENIRSSGVSIAAVTAPENVEGFRASEQNETSITLQWNKGDNNTSFVLQFNGTETNISAPDGDGPVYYTVSSLTAGTKYTFILYRVFMNVSSAVNITVATAPINVGVFRASEQNETSITLQWNKINNITSFVLLFNGSETFITASNGDGPVNYKVSLLTAGTKYTFTLFSVFENVRSSGIQFEAVTAPTNTENVRASHQNESSITLQWNKINNSTSFVLQNIRSSGVSIAAVTAPENAEGFRASEQNETSITLQWNKGDNNTSFVLQFILYSVFENVRSSGIQFEAVTAPTNTENVRASHQNESSITLQWNKINNSTNFILQFNGSETFITAPDGDGPVNHTVSLLTAGTKYTFTLYSVFENVRSSGIQYQAVTAPTNTKSVRASDQDETSITLHWNKINNSTSFVLLFNGSETFITAPDGDGPVKYKVSFLTAGTKYTFTLYSVFENVRSSGIQLTAVTAPQNAQGFTSLRQDETSITLQWEIVNNNVSFILLHNETQLTIAAPAGQQPNIRSSGVSIAAVTAPQNAEGFRASEQNETSITLQWNKGDNNTSFVLQFNGSETNITAPDRDGPVNHTVTSLTAGTRYTFILYRVFMNVRSSAVNITVATAPQNAQGFTLLREAETSITLQWEIVNNNVSFILQYNETQLTIAAPAGQQPVLLTVSSLTAGTRYTFTLFSVFENVRSSGVSIAAVTAPENAEGFRASEQNETSITLQWNKGDNNTSFVLQYTFILYRVFMNVRSSAVNITVATAPINVGGLRASDQNETSITLQWNKINNSTSYVLQFNGSETFITAPVADGRVNYKVSYLNAGTRYTFILFSVFENVRSSGVSIAAVTAPENAEGFRASEQNETSITLQWNKGDNNTSFVLQFNGSETNITAPDGDGPVNHTVTSLTAGTTYTFILYRVFMNVRSSAVNINVATAPINVGGLRASYQNESSITLQWNKINNSTSFVLQFNGSETFIRAPDGDGPVNHTVSFLTAGTKYTFTLFSVFENVRSSGIQHQAVTAPMNIGGLRASDQNETSITLQWNKISNSTNFVLQFNGSETFITAPDADGRVNYKVSFLNAGTKYTFTLYSVFENIRSSAVQFEAASAPKSAEGFWSPDQDESSITLQWNKINNSTNFILQVNSIQIFIRAPDGDGPVTHKVSFLTAGTKYTFTLFSVFENVRSSGVQLTAVTAPKNAGGFRASKQDETSITLRWNKVGNNISFVLQFNGTETNISAPDRDGPVNHTVTSLTARTNYTFTLFSVFENVRSSGVSILAFTGKICVSVGHLIH
ncbi:tenascin-X-like [Poeciliopsis prolifica]|uniref:tenascin-X-like n=1 Tax=Poeciliopsis prolifica TaxID=188132 RepID=UPI0024135D8A|nr:tenascin-X-like [Poeciliopsis prolifica]